MPSDKESDQDSGVKVTDESEILSKEEEPLEKLKRFVDRFKKTEETHEQKSDEVDKLEQDETEIKTLEVIKSLLEPANQPQQKSSSKTKLGFEQFVDESSLLSGDVFGKKQMKIKVLEVSDEIPSSIWRLGNRVKVTKILVTIKHFDTQKIEEAEFDIEAIEKELKEKRKYTSSNRWVPTIDIKNGYVLGTRHMSLISDAFALDYIAF